VEIRRLDARATAAAREELAALLVDAVDGGASVGFLPPLPAADAGHYWDEVIEALGGPHRVLLAALVGGCLAGAVQLELAARTNGSHRAEVTKLMVLRDRRRAGLGRALMLAAEEEAARLGRTTLVLDTRVGDPSQRLYATLGYALCGVIPAYARSADGTLHATAVMYKLLGR